MMRFSVRGVRELDTKLRLIVARLRTDLPEAMQRIAEGTAKVAPSYIGRERLGWTGRVGGTDPLLGSGAMRRSIRGEGDALIVTVRAAPPARWQEMCTKNKHVPARPFLRPALRETAPDALKLLRETFETTIRET